MHIFILTKINMKGYNTMNQKMIILSSELEFRNCVDSNLNLIYQLLVFEDTLASTIYFYCYTQNHIVFATKERLNNNFKTYKKYYKRIAKKLKLCIFPNSKQLICRKL
jgi:hypothetical protein